jgi:hypothetical protein
MWVDGAAGVKLSIQSLFDAVDFFYRDGAVNDEK